MLPEAYVLRALFPESYFYRVLCIQNSILPWFPKHYISRALHFQNLMFQELYVSRAFCFHNLIFPELNISSSHIFQSSMFCLLWLILCNPMYVQETEFISSPSKPFVLLSRASRIGSETAVIVIVHLTSPTPIWVIRSFVTWQPHILCNGDRN